MPVVGAVGFLRAFPQSSKTPRSNPGSELLARSCHDAIHAPHAEKKKNRWNLAEFQRFSLVQNGGRSRTRIYDLHDVNVEECLYSQWFVKLFGNNSVNSVFI